MDENRSLFLTNVEILLLCIVKDDYYIQNIIRHYPRFDSIQTRKCLKRLIKFKLIKKVKKGRMNLLYLTTKGEEVKDHMKKIYELIYGKDIMKEFHK